MPGGGTLSIAIQRVGERVEIVIRDTGCGIPPNHMARIQEPFFTTKPNGNGLGLSICRSIVWNARGELQIDSQVGLGTQMKVSLPVVDERTGGRMA